MVRHGLNEDRLGHIFKLGDHVKCISMARVYSKAYPREREYIIEQYDKSDDICLCVRGIDDDLTNISHGVFEIVGPEWD